jgi:phosphatidylethanolamine-binding protein (PEBP) family uncharacterized protein
MFHRIIRRLIPASHRTSAIELWGLARGQTPEGGIVGAVTDSKGRNGYGGICPVHQTRVKFFLYALSERISLTPGFQPTVAEREYAAHKVKSAEGGERDATLIAKGASLYGLYK